MKDSITGVKSALFNWEWRYMLRIGRPKENKGHAKKTIHRAHQIESKAPPLEHDMSDQRRPQPTKTSQVKKLSQPGPVDKDLDVIC